MQNNSSRIILLYFTTQKYNRRNSTHYTENTKTKTHPKGYSLFCRMAPRSDLGVDNTEEEELRGAGEEGDCGFIDRRRLSSRPMS